MKASAIVILLFALFSFSLACAQDSTSAPKTGTTRSESLQDRWYYGGNIGFNLLNDYTYLGIFPLIGYKVTPQFSVGGKAGYAYISDDRYKLPSSVNTSNYGGSAFSRYRIVPQLYVHGEFAYWSYENVKSYNLGNGTYTTERDWVPFLWLGGGHLRRLH
ncbi:MAG: hypothetical protein HKP58_13795, partial [Desulfatitalea sp.]|nr:hypothetical protein [Desulfatitalea sp.]NNK01475.1 hypothetical protein [Desulfatitalea sp.]